MKNSLSIFILGIVFFACNSIELPDVVKHSVVASCDDNVTLTPDTVLVLDGQSAFFNVVTKDGYKCIINVNGKIIPLTSSLLKVPFVTKDMIVKASTIKQFTIRSTHDKIVDVEPDSALVVQGHSTTFKITTKPGYYCYVKLNNSRVNLTENSLYIENVTSDMKIDVESGPIRKYKVDATIDKNGNVSPSSLMADSGYVKIRIFSDAQFGYVIDKCKVNGIERSFTPYSVTLDNLNCDSKIEFSTKEVEIDPYFNGVKWRLEYVYMGYVGTQTDSYYFDAYILNRVYYFISNGNYLTKNDGVFSSGYLPWSIDKSTIPNTFTWEKKKWNVDVLTKTRFEISYVDPKSYPALEYKYSFSPE